MADLTQTVSDDGRAWVARIPKRPFWGLLSCSVSSGLGGVRNQQKRGQSDRTGGCQGVMGGQWGKIRWEVQMGHTIHNSIVKWGAGRGVQGEDVWVLAGADGCLASMMNSQSQLYDEGMICHHCSLLD